ncbi:hypothetical protein QQ045_004410 [Rhodiola kirilowii]
MGSQLHTVLIVLLLGVVAIQAATPSELYWKSVLPNTPMPKAIEDILSPDVLEEESTSVGVGKGGVGVKTGQPGKGTTVGVGKGGVGVKNGKPGKGTTVGVGKGGVGVRTGNGGRTKVGVGKGGVNVGTPGKKGKPPVVVGVKPGANPFNYHYAATQDQLQDDRQTAVFFLEKDLSPNTEMNLVFTKSGKGATFLPRQVSDSLPFSSAQLPSILNHYSVSLESEEAEEMKQTVSECEQPAVKGEEKYCATSLESMIDFTTSKLGKNIQAVSTEVDKETDQVQKYTILKGVKKIASGKTVVCHKEKYPYAVFFCHATSTTRAYVVPLLGADGTKAKATAVCHTDTASWNPKHLAFQILKVKPGTVPVCHFLPEDHIVWTRN